MKEDGTYQQIMDKYLATGDTGDGSTSLSFWGCWRRAGPPWMQGLGMTLAATALSLLFATVLGVIFGFFKVSGVWILKLLGSIYVDVFRGTPLLVQAFFFYFGLPAATGLKIDVFVAGVLTLSLNAGAYMTEIVRGGIQNVDTGQMEASRSLGLNWMQSMRKIIKAAGAEDHDPGGNQPVRHHPEGHPLLLAVLGLAELTYQGQQIIARTFRSFEMWLIIGAIYFVVIFALTKLSNALDRRINKSTSGAPPRPPRRRGDVIVEVEDLHKSFGSNEVLKGIDTTIRKGEVVAIIGPSGSGKSTFLRWLNLLEEVTPAGSSSRVPI